MPIGLRGLNRGFTGLNGFYRLFLVSHPCNPINPFNPRFRTADDHDMTDAADINLILLWSSSESKLFSRSHVLRRNADGDILKQEFLTKAKENLKSAQLNFDNECYNACANRAYYASFQAAIAALSAHGIISDKNEHSWVQSEFNFQLIKRRKIYPGKLKSYLLKMQEIRNIADYSDENISKKIAYRQLSQTTEMIRNIEKELKL